jgi:hypothetical protein
MNSRQCCGFGSGSAWIRIRVKSRILIKFKTQERVEKAQNAAMEGRERAYWNKAVERGSNNINNRQDPDEDMKQTEIWIRIRIKIKRGTDRIPLHCMLCTAYIQKKVFVKLEFITKVLF